MADPHPGNLGQAPNAGRRCHAGQPHSVAHAAVSLAALLAALGVRHGTTWGLVWEELAICHIGFDLDMRLKSG